MRYLALLLTFLCAGCATTPVASFKLSDEVTLHVVSMEATDDSFQAKVWFYEDTEHAEIIQEGRLHTGQNFIEKFAANSNTYTDTHHYFGLRGSPRVTRTMTVYAGLTAGTDATFAGFAMLPRNMDGSVVSTIDPAGFNVKYNSKHRITGAVVRESKTRGEWSLTWTANKLLLTAPDGTLTWEAGRYVRTPAK